MSSIISFSVSHVKMKKGRKKKPVFGLDIEGSTSQDDLIKPKHFLNWDLIKNYKESTCFITQKLQLVTEEDLILKQAYLNTELFGALERKMDMDLFQSNK